MSKQEVFEKFMTYIAGYTQKAILFTTLDEDKIDSLENIEDCHLLKSQDLIKKIMIAASLSTKLQFAVFRQRGQECEVSLSLVDNDGHLELLASPPIQHILLNKTAILVFNLFGSSYCTAVTPIKIDGENIHMPMPEMIYLRRRRRTERLLMANPVDAEILIGMARVPVKVVNMSEYGLCFVVSGSPNISWFRVRGIRLNLANEQVDIEGEVRWTTFHDGKTFGGIVFGAGTIEVCQRLAGRRKSVRHHLQTPEKCMITSEEVGRIGGYVLDLTEMGARIETVEEIPSPPKFVEFTTELDGIEIKLEAEVRWIESLQGKSAMGIKFVFMQSDAREKILSYLIPKIRPHLSDVREDELDRVIEIYETVNYFGETGKGGKGNKILEQFRDVWGRLLKQGRHLGRLLCTREANRITGVCGLSRVYTSTWLIHSMAGLRGIDILPAEHLRLGLMEILERDVTTEFIMGFFLSSKHYSQKYYISAVSVVRDPDQHFWFTLNVVDCDIDEIETEKIQEGECEIANEDETEMFCELIKNCYPPIYLQSISLDRKDVGIGQLSNEYERLGIERARLLFVQRRNNQPIGFCLLEISSPGLTLNGCTDGMWLYPCESAKTSKELLPLFRASIEYLKRIHRKKSNLFCYGIDPNAFVMKGTHLIPDLSIWVGRVEAASEVKNLWKFFYDQHKLDRIEQMIGG